MIKLQSIIVYAGVFCAHVVLADQATVNGITWQYKVSNGMASIDSGAFVTAAIPTSTVGSVTIPSKLANYPVTKIARFAFWRCNEITNVTIPDSIKDIEASAFGHCVGIENVAIPNGVTNIGQHAFQNCSHLKSVVISPSVRSINCDAFVHCCELSGISVDPLNSVYKSENGLLLSKDGKTLVIGINGNVTIPNGVTSVGEYAFNGFSNLRSIVFPDSLTTIAKYSFALCSNLRSIAVPSSVTNIANQAFSSCTELANVSVDSSNPIYKSEEGLLLSKDGKTLVVGTKGINGMVSIPSGVIAIDEGAFTGRGLTKIVLPSSVERVGDSAFISCSNLECVVFEGNKPWFGSSPFALIPTTCTFYVLPGSSGWNKSFLA